MLSAKQSYEEQLNYDMPYRSHGIWAEQAGKDVINCLILLEQDQYSLKASEKK